MREGAHRLLDLAARRPRRPRGQAGPAEPGQPRGDHRALVGARRATTRASSSTCAGRFAIGYDSSDRELLAGMAQASGGKPVHANILLRFTGRPDVWRECLDVARGLRPRRPARVPDGVGQPQGHPHRAARHDHARRDADVPDHADAAHGRAHAGPARPGGARPAAGRVRRHRQPPVRLRLVGAAGRRRARRRPTPTGTAAPSPTSRRARRRPLRHLPRPGAGRGPRDRVRRRPPRRPRRTATSSATSLKHPLTTPGSSDGGAHLNTFCGADYTTRILTEYADATGSRSRTPSASSPRCRRRRSGCGTAARSGPARRATSCCSIATGSAWGPCAWSTTCRAGRAA